LASGAGDHTVLIWDLTGQRGGPAPAPRLGQREMERLWSELASADATRAYRAGWALASLSDRAVDLLRQRLRLLLKQDAADRSRLAEGESEDLRIVRAAVVLEEIGTDKAKELLREIAEQVRRSQQSSTGN